MKALRDNARPFVAILGLILIATVVGAYILNQQGLRFPFVQESPVRMTAVLSTAQGVTPGQNQTVQVAGVQVGKIRDVTLRDGRAVLQLDMERRYVKEGLVRTDARALLRPRTPLKDMYLQLFPGTWQKPAARKGFEIPLANTMPDVNLDEVLAQLDTRTRDYLALLLKGTGEGLGGRGADLAEVFKRFGPTVRDLGRVNRELAQERVALRRVVSSFARLSGRLAQRPQELSGLVSSSSDVFRALASEDDNLRDTVGELPATLQQATRTLQNVRPLADVLGPTATALTPALQALERANRQVLPLAREATPIVRRQIRPFVRAARPLVADLAPAAAALDPSIAELRRGGAVLNTFVNLLGFNENGRQAPGVSSRDEGYLYWLAWATHQGNNLINVDDAIGPLRPAMMSGTCATLTSLVNIQPELEFGMALSPLLATLCGDPQTRSIRAVKSASADRTSTAEKGP